MMTAAWVSTNTAKIGTSAVTDSFTPRRLSTMSRSTPNSAAESLSGSHSAGRKLNRASAPLATESVTVST